jgi:hypothetical protein
MSLISDALKKARQEAARQDSLRQGVPYAVGPVDSPDRRRTLVPLLAGLAVGAVLAGGVAGFVYFTDREPAAAEEVRVAEAAPPAVVQEVPETAPAPEATAPPVVPTLPPVVTEPPPAVTIPPERVPEAAAPVPPPAAQPQPDPEIRLEPSQPSVPQPEEPSPIPGEPIPVAPPPAQESKSFVEDVPVPGGGTLRLNGIAFSTVSPVAVIDGKVVGPGEVVQGFTVVEIQQNRVKLEGHGETVYVSLK